MIQVGDKLPENLGTDSHGNPVTASQYLGKGLVLYVYPKDNTSGCTAEACSFRDNLDALKDEGYEVVGVSKDSAASHLKFADKHSLPFPLIADTDTRLLQELGAWGEKNMYGKKVMGTLRTTYVVGPDGIVKHIFQPKQIKTKEHAQQVLEIIKE